MVRHFTLYVVYYSNQQRVIIMLGVRDIQRRAWPEGANKSAFAGRWTV